MNVTVAFLARHPVKGLSPESLAGIIDESEDEDEFLAILRVAYGRGPNEAERPSDPKATDGASGAS